MNNKQLAPKVGAWLKSTDVAPEDVRRSVGLVSGQAGRTRQRGRWWPLPTFRRKPETQTTTDATAYRPSHIPATNGHNATVIGRTQTMFSPVKAIIAGALAFTLGGVFLIAQPDSQQGSVPGAQQPAAQSEQPDMMASAAVTLEVSPPRLVSGPSTEVDDAGVTHYRGIETAMDWVASDPRLSGEVTYHGAWDDFGGYAIETNTYEVVNDGGRWFGPATSVTANEEHIELTVLKGEGGYEGLTAYVFGGGSLEGAFAVIFPGEPIPMPERSPAP